MSMQCFICFIVVVTIVAGTAFIPSASFTADHWCRSTAFRKLCQQRSECSSADNAGQLCGDLGWARDQEEAISPCLCSHK